MSWFDILLKGDFEFRPDLSRRGVFSRKDKSVRLNLSRFGRDLKFPGFEAVDEEGNINPEMQEPLERQLASTLGHEFTHYATVDDYAPMQEEARTEIMHMVESGSLDDNVAKKQIEILASVQFWIELVANAHDMHKMATFLNTDWAAVYLRKVRDAAINVIIMAITDDRAGINPVNSTPFRLHMLDKYIDDEVYAGDKVKEELIALYHLFNDVVPQHTVDLQMRMKKFFGV